MAASAEHTRQLYAAGQAAKGTSASSIPFVSMRAIVQSIPVVDADNAPQQEWHWDKASPAFKEAILDGALGSITGAVSGLSQDLLLQAHEGASRAIREALQAHDLASHKLDAAVDLCLKWLIAQVEPMIPTQDRILRAILVNS